MSEEKIGSGEDKNLIYITKGLRLNCKDDRNIVPQEAYVKKDKEIGWRDHGYHMRVEDAIARVIEMKLLPGKEVTLNQYIEFLKNFRVQLLKEVVHHSNIKK